MIVVENAKKNYATKHNIHHAHGHRIARRLSPSISPRANIFSLLTSHSLKRRAKRVRNRRTKSLNQSFIFISISYAQFAWSIRKCLPHDSIPSIFMTMYPSAHTHGSASFHSIQNAIYYGHAGAGYIFTQPLATIQASPKACRLEGV